MQQSVLRQMMTRMQKVINSCTTGFQMKTDSATICFKTNEDKDAKGNLFMYYRFSNENI